MTDELDDLRKAMQVATPAPDVAAKAAHLALAEKNFDQLQGSADAVRPTLESQPKLGWLGRGVRKMTGSVSSLGALTATTALVAVGLIAFLQQSQELLSPPGPGMVLEGTTSSLDVTDGRGQEPAAPVLNLTTGTTEAERNVAGELGLAQREQNQLQNDRPVMEPVIVVEESDYAEGDLAIVGGITDLDGRFLSEVTDEEETFADLAGASEPSAAGAQEDTEAFPENEASSVKIVAEEPVSTFSIDVDTAAYGVVRSSLMGGYLPPKDAVRIEEMINYFPYTYPAPASGEAPFKANVSTLETPWNPDTKLIHIGIQGAQPEMETAPPLNLVFLIDTSGSMDSADKLPLLKQSFRLLLSELRPEDEVAIVTYAGSAGLALKPTKAGNTRRIMRALSNLDAGGSTAGQAGLQQAYATADAMAEDGEVTRVILATDGDFNVGISDPKELEDFIADKRDTGTYLSVLGFGRGNLDDEIMQTLAQNGNGQASYIDTLSEARKVLVDQVSGALFPIANDVKIQIEFNPAQIAEYRLIGYETRALAREDFNNDRVDAGDIGAGHTVTAIYEVTPVGSPAQLSDPLRYQPAADAGEAVPVSTEWGYLRLRYKNPGEETSQLIERPIAPVSQLILDDVYFSVAIAGFGELLRGNDRFVNWSYDEAVDYAQRAKGDDPFGYRAEAITLMRLAESIEP